MATYHQMDINSIYTNNHNHRILTSMTLQDFLIKLSAYNINFRVYSGNFVIEVKFDSSWTLVKPDNPNIAFANDDDVPGLCYYMTPVTTDLSEVFDAINDTVRFNEELKLKISLFKEKVEELHKLFADESYDRLKTLVFKMDKRKQPKNKQQDAKSEIQQEEKQESGPTESERSENSEKVNQSVPENQATQDDNQGVGSGENQQSESGSEIDRKIKEALKNNRRRK